MLPQITVITPTIVARQQLLNRAMRSVQRQTLPAAAMAVAADLTRAGASATRQRALDMARTEWVAPLDDDDAFKAVHLATLYEHAMETGADYVYSWFDMIGGNDPFPLTHYTESFERASELAGMPIETTITVLVRRELAQEVGYTPLDRGHDANSGEDYGFLLGCLAAGAKVSHVVAKTWQYFYHGNNTSGLPTKGDALRWLPPTE